MLGQGAGDRVVARLSRPLAQGGEPAGAEVDRVQGDPERSAGFAVAAVRRCPRRRGGAECETGGVTRDRAVVYAYVPGSSRHLGAGLSELIHHLEDAAREPPVTAALAATVEDPPMPELSTDVEHLLAGLNPPQREAVTHGEGPLLILAGAGSGKTRVLTHRIAYLVAMEFAKPNEILAITFTNKAAGEMRERAGLLVGGRVRAMWVMTFHSACARMLRAHADRLGYTRQFTIYDQADSRRLVKRCLDELGGDPTRFTPAAIQNQISY